MVLTYRCDVTGVGGVVGSWFGCRWGGTPSYGGGIVGGDLDGVEPHPTAMVSTSGISMGCNPILRRRYRRSGFRWGGTPSYGDGIVGEDFDGLQPHPTAMAPSVGMSMG